MTNLPRAAYTEPQQLSGEQETVFASAWNFEESH